MVQASPRSTKAKRCQLSSIVAASVIESHRRSSDIAMLQVKKTSLRNHWISVIMQLERHMVGVQRLPQD